MSAWKGRPIRLLDLAKLSCTPENLSNLPPSSPLKGHCSSASGPRFSAAAWNNTGLPRNAVSTVGPGASEARRPIFPRRTPTPRRQGAAIRGVVEEILLGEVLTRVWTAVLCLYDRHHGNGEIEPLARSIMVGHHEARHRVLMLLVRKSSVTAEGAIRLNHLRRRAERWTDLLLGHLTRLGDVSEFAIDAERAIEFSRDLEYESDQKAGRQVWPLLRASLRAAFQRGLADVSPNEDLNSQIGAAIVSCFPADAFDSTGLYRSLCLHRIANVTNDVQGMIDSLVGSGTTLGE